MKRLLVALVARVPARVQTKLLVALLVMVALLIIVGAVGLRSLSSVNQQTEELITLQRKIAAYRRLQLESTNQLYSVASALLVPEERTLDATLRQLNQFDYDLDWLQFVAKEEAELIGQIRQDYERFVAVVTQTVGLIRGGQVGAAREMQLAKARPLADRLESATVKLVNIAEADIVASIAASRIAITLRFIFALLYGDSRLGQAGRWIEVDFVDNGPGIPPDVLPRIFEPFFTTKTTGSGLGLAVSYGIIERNGGQLSVNSMPGQGTRFNVRLPVADDGASQADSFLVTVQNAAPLLDIGGDQLATEGEVVSLPPATFRDPGTLDTHSAIINWGAASSTVRFTSSAVRASSNCSTSA